jgi:L-ascorbate metabolism protein UlaG (beta-lactamase superfamily)
MNAWRTAAIIGLVQLSLAVASAQEKKADAKKDTKSGAALVEEIRRHEGDLAIWWTGHNGWLIKGDGLLIGTDLVMDDRSRETRSPVSAAEIGPLLDVSIVTHAHGDHFNGPTSRVLVAQSKCLFVLPKSCLEAAKRYGIPEERIVVAKPREPLDVKGIKIEPLRAIHGNRKGAVYWEANLDDCGYVIRMKGKSIMQPGDSVLLEDHLFVKHVDVLFFSPTEHNMQVENSVTLINELEPDYIVPQHRNTYPTGEATRFWANAYHIEVRGRLAKDLQKRYHIVEMGERLDVAP